MLLTTVLTSQGCIALHLSFSAEHVHTSHGAGDRVTCVQHVQPSVVRCEGDREGKLPSAHDLLAKGSQGRGTIGGEHTDAILEVLRDQDVAVGREVNIARGSARRRQCAARTLQPV